MPIKFNCHNCGAKLRVPEKHVGKKARCPKCDEKCLVPEMSVQDSDLAIGGNFEDIGSFLDQPAAAPVGLPPAVGVPVASSTGPPAMATPVTPRLPSSVPPPTFHSPYSTPMAQKPSGGSMSASLMQPLYEARTMMKIWGWMAFVIGILYCLTIIGAIVGWLFIWMGWLVKGAGEAVTVGIETGDQAQLRLANERLGTFFKILGVLAIIWLAIMALYLLLIIFVFILGIAGVASGM